MLDVYTTSTLANLRYAEMIKEAKTYNRVSAIKAAQARLNVKSQSKGNKSLFASFRKASALK